MPATSVGRQQALPSYENSHTAPGSVQFHPDVYQGEGTVGRLLNEAYATLSDPQARATFDAQRGAVLQRDAACSATARYSGLPLSRWCGPPQVRRTAMEKLRIVILRFGTARQKRVLE
jgi:curved DNA-binding protein CbpA